MINSWTNSIQHDENSCSIPLRSAGNIFKLKPTFFPAHTEDKEESEPQFITKHWHLIVANMQTKRIMYRDGIRSLTRAKDLILVKNYIISEFEHKNKIAMTEEDKSKWVFERVVEYHTQPNPYDCGMYACAYAYCILFDQDPGVYFAQKDIDELRLKFTFSILRSNNDKPVMFV